MSTSDEVKMITQGSSTILSSLLRGSAVLTGRICRCLPRLAALGPALWAMACRDAQATDEKQQRAFDAALAAARKANEADPEPGDIPRVVPVRRPRGEALGFLTVGAVVGFGALGTAFSVAGPRLLAVVPDGIGPYVFAAAAVAWTAAALALAPPSPDEEPEDEDQEDQEQREDEQELGEEQSEERRGTELLLHVLLALSDAEYTKRTGVHLDAVLASAVARGLLDTGTELSDFRAWVESTGLPTVDKLGMRIAGTPTTRVGVRVDAATAALGMTPTTLLEAHSQALVQAPGKAPAMAVPDPAQVPAPAVEEELSEVPVGTPVEAPVATPVPAVLRLIPGGLQDPARTPSPPPSQGQGQEAR
ncbi:hypothetical protein ACTVZO_41635 [Streptomyces sp. IBSNAI002]|uniref:hypothetical protein n=1 Tax=Streptomyces sp. IBSNAI002 TaxID=3457500 RepID=UPI003FCF914A